MKRIHRTIALLTALVAASFLLAGPALAVHPDERSELENLRERIEALEAEEAPADEPFDVEALGKHLSLGGLLELEAVYQDNENDGDVSDLALATAQVDFIVEINDHIGGHIILLHEEGEDLVIDEAAISLVHPVDALGGDLGITGGLLYLPFGNFNSNFISDPLTLELGETADTALLLGWSGNGVEVTLGAFNGEVDTLGDNDTIDSWVAAVNIVPVEGLSVGASYISDLAESDIGLVAGNYSSSVAGASVYASAALGSFTLDAEYLTALEDFDASVVPGEGLTGDDPSAWNLELGFSPDERWLVAVKAEGSDDFADDLNRYGAAASYGLFPNTVVALEYLYGDSDAGDSNTVTAQLAMEF